MSEATVSILLLALGAYLALGLVIGLICIFGGISRVDPAAKSMPFRARFLVLPGLIALWPLIATRLLSKRGPPI